jgi:hypothetical protein
MPFGFPSHPGLIAPLWRLWPDRFSVLALWVGAVTPDVVDGVASPALRGRLGQWVGHSVLGLFVVCVPIGLGLTELLRRGARRAAAVRPGGRGRDALRRIGSWTCAVDNAPRATSTVRRALVEAPSVWTAALSHIAFDLLSHDGSMLLWPWSRDPAWFGRWWSAAWLRVSVPGYHAYSIGPHFVAWVVLSIAGAVMFFKWPPRTRRP